MPDPVVVNIVGRGNGGRADPSSAAGSPLPGIGRRAELVGDRPCLVRRHRGRQLMTVRVADRQHDDVEAIVNLDLVAAGVGRFDRHRRKRRRSVPGGHDEGDKARD